VSGRQAFHPFLLAQRGTAAARALLLVFGLLGLSFFRLQVLQHDKYQLKSESNRLRPVPLPAPRGLILDRRGRIIAENVPGYSVLVLAANADSLRAMLARLEPLVALDTEQVRRIIQRYRAAPYEPTLVVKDAPFALVAHLEERRSTLPGLVIQTEPKRMYPDSTAVAHIVGYVGEVTEQELATPAYGDRRPGAIVGQEGLEREYEDSLKGSDGVRFVEVDALGRVIRDQGAPALATEPGHVIRTTINLDLQRFVASIFPATRRGAIVAMDPRSGAILALYSNPAYDPNAFVGGIQRGSWRALNEDPARPLLNRAIATRYPPASTFKLAIATMALRHGVVRFDSHMPQPCRGGIQIGNRFFRCWKADGHGSLDLVGAIASSCDVYFYQLGMRLGVTSLLEDGNAMGFRSVSGIDLPGELTSAFPAGPAYYDRLYGRGRWTNAVAVNLAIGQGENAQTLINMVRFYAALANGGHVPTPYVVRERVALRPVVQLPESTFLGVRQALIAVVERGTARGVRLERLRLAGKTGTAQNPHGPDHGWFIGFAPAADPAIVVGGIMEFAEHGTIVASYVARVVEHYLLGPDPARAADTETVRLRIPEDTAPSSEPRDSAAPPSPRAPRPAAPRPATAPAPGKRR
jgi:penicillin-binding protein 2